MKVIKRVLIKYFEAVQEYILLVPFLIIIGDALFGKSNNYKFFIIVLILYMAGIIICKLSEGKARILEYLLILITAGSLTICFFNFQLLSIIFFILCSLLLFRGTVIMQYSLNMQSLPTAIYYIVIFAYIVVGVVCTKIERYADYKLLLTICGVISAIIILFKLNKLEMNCADARNKNSVNIPNTLKKHNRQLVSGILAFSLLISFWHQLIDGIVWAMKKIIDYIVLLFIFISNMFTVKESNVGAKTQNQNMFPFAEQVQQKPDSVFTKIIYALIIVAVAVGFAVLLYFIIKKLYFLLKKFISYVIKHMIEKQNVYNEYEEEKEQIMSIEELGKKYLSDIKKKIEKLLEREVKWKDLKNNNEKAKYIYRISLYKMIKKGYELKQSYTPIEVYKDLERKKYNNQIISKDFIDLYNKAKYSDELIKNENIECYYKKL